MVILAAVLLAACAGDTKSGPPPSGPLPTGQVTYWDILRAQFEDHMKTDSYTKIPADVRHRISACMADYVVDNVTPAQLRHLDAVAAGTETPDPDLSTQLDRQVTASIDKLDRNDLGLLTSYCPNDVSNFKKYAGP